MGQRRGRAAHPAACSTRESGRLAALRDERRDPGIHGDLRGPRAGDHRTWAAASPSASPTASASRAWTGTDERDASTSADLEYGNLIAPGEFLLGYLNEYVRYTDRPLLNPALVGAGDLPFAPEDAGRRDLGRNGTYLVFRQLHQDVRGFWRFIASQSARRSSRLAWPRRWSAARSRAIPSFPCVDRPIRGVGPDAADIARNRFTYELTATA